MTNAGTSDAGTTRAAITNAPPGIQRIAIVGAGAWGAALAGVAARAGRDVTLCPRDAAALAALEAARAPHPMPDLRLDDRVAFALAEDAVAAADAILLVVPTQAVGEVAAALAPHIRAGTPVVACAKGIERESRRFVTEIVAQHLPDAVPAILSGPSFAADVARALPTAVTLAAQDAAIAATLAHALGAPAFRPYHTTDLRGVEIGGAAKNVLAIAAGVAHGRRLGASAAAALVTRGFAELFRFGAAYGARPETLTGLSGLGDLILTCSSAQSRNFSFGVALGEGRPPDGKLVEGAFTAPVLVEMAAAKGVDMPIAGAVDAMISGRWSVDAAIEALLTRPLRGE